MSNRQFGWDLPPGVTHRMIEDQFGDRPGFIEDFEGAKGKELSPGAKETLDRLYDDEDMGLLVEEIAAWACSEGHREEAEDRAMEPPDPLHAAASAMLTALGGLYDWETLPHGQYKVKYGCLFEGRDGMDEAADAKHREHIELARTVMESVEKEKK